MPDIFIATASGRYHFLAIGDTAGNARAALMAAWSHHVELTGADPDYIGTDDIDVIKGTYGTAFRDGSVFPRTDDTTETE